MKLFLIGLAAAATGMGRPALQTQSSPTFTESNNQFSRDSDREAFFAWFDKQGYQPVVTGKFVEPKETAFPQLGRWAQDRNFGFLADSKSGLFTIVTPGLAQLRGESGPDPLKPNYTEVKFDDWAKARLVGYTKSTHSRADDDLARKNSLTNLELAVLSRACEARGLEELSKKYFHYAILRLGNGDRFEEQALRDAVAYAGENSCHETLNDTRLPRSVALGEFRIFVKRFPHFQFIDQMRAAIPVLEKMVAEDDEHERRGTVDLDKLSVHDRTEELIFRLRDQIGPQTSVPGGVDPFGDGFGIEFGQSRGGAENEPATMLAKIGYPAVPQLIDHLADDRFTRCIGLTRFRPPSTYSATVGYVTEAILDRIAGRSFRYVVKDNTATPRDDSAMKAVIQAWWKNAHARGERETLLSQIRAADSDSLASCRRLTEAYPDAAFDAIIPYLKLAPEYDVSELFSLIGTLKDPRAEPFLESRLKPNAPRNGKFRAAEIVAAKNPKLAVDSALLDWTSTGPNDEELNGAGSLMESTFLITSGRAQVVRAIRESMPRKSIESRAFTLDELGGDELPPILSGYPTLPKPSGDEKVAYLREVKALLGSELTDTERSSMASIRDQGYTVERVPLCQEAAWALSKHWPEEFHFNVRGTAAERNRDRVACLNEWRKENGLPPVTVGSKPTNPAVAKARVERLSTLILEQPPTERKASAAELAQMGVGALPELVRCKQVASPTSPGLSALDEVQRSLQCTVAQVQIVGPSSATKRIEHHLQACNGKELTTNSIIRLLRLSMKTWPKDLLSFKIEVERSADGYGTTLVASFEHGHPTGEPGWWMSELMSSTGTGSGYELANGKGHFVFGNDGQLKQHIHNELLRGNDDGFYFSLDIQGRKG